jgi:hypothetical protein
VVREGASFLPRTFSFPFTAHRFLPFQAAGHGNEDAQGRIDALQQSNPEALNRNDHDAHVETKLVRKRTQAKLRSDEQIERAAASRLASSLQGPQLTNNSAPPQLYQPQPHLGYPQQQPLRQSTGGSSVSASSGQTLRRQATLRQVEAAAHSGPAPLGTPNPHAPMRYPSPAPNRVQSVQLSDGPAQGLPTTRRNSPARPPQVIPIKQVSAGERPSTFADMVRLPFPFLSFLLLIPLLRTGHPHTKSEEGRLSHHVDSSSPPRSFPSFPPRFRSDTPFSSLLTSSPYLLVQTSSSRRPLPHTHTVRSPLQTIFPSSFFLFFSFPSFSSFRFLAQL